MKTKINLTRLESDSFTMTLERKGQIFELWDKGNSYNQISQITGWSEHRIFILIDAIRGDRFWSEAIALWQDHIKTKERVRKVSESYEERQLIGRTTSSGKSRSNIRRKSNKKAIVYKSKETVYKPRTTKRSSRPNTRRYDIRQDFNKQESGGRIVKSLKNLKDYQGS